MCLTQSTEVHMAVFFFAPKFLCLFELMLGVPVNSYGHVGTLPPFYWTYMYTQNKDVMTSKNRFKYNHPTKPLRLICMNGST